MLLKGIKDEDFCQYKDPCMFVIFPTCTFKCEQECGEVCCQNSSLSKSPNITIPVEEVIERYLSNPITSTVVCGGLEPFDSYEDLLKLISELRQKTDDTVIVYTGYTEEEVKSHIDELSQFKNIIVKFGRFVPHKGSRFDDILGVQLASSNQYAKRIS